MPKERDPRVTAIAEKLVEIQPYGKDWRKTEPSVADYHTALIAVRTLDGMAEYEYSMQTIRGGQPTSVFLDGDWGTLEVAQERVDRYTDSWRRLGYDYLSAKIVKRRKAGKVEEL